MGVAEGWEWLLPRAAEARSAPDFRQRRQERVELAALVRAVLDAAQGDDALAPSLDALFRPRPRVPWPPPLAQWIRSWSSTDEQSLRDALRLFATTQPGSPADRIERFATVAGEAAEAHSLQWRPLLVLLFGSMLNFALEPEQLPVIRREFPVLERALGYDPKDGAGPRDQYEHHAAFARELRARMEQADVPVRDMIDVEMCAFDALHEPRATFPRLPDRGRLISILDDTRTAMTVGERAAVEGILAQLKPALAIEIGAGLGGTLERLASHGAEVHEIELAAPPDSIAGLDHVHWHQGDSHVLLPQLLERFYREGRNVEFVLVDGDHSAAGARRDMEDLLESPAIGRTVILAHDTMKESVREGLEQLDYESYPKVAYVELDFVAGGMYRPPSIRYQLWGGLGLIVVDATEAAPLVRQDRLYDMHPLVAEMKQILMRREASSELPRSDP